jgi:hypothetical protein
MVRFMLANKMLQSVFPFELLQPFLGQLGRIEKYTREANILAVKTKISMTFGHGFY